MNWVKSGEVVGDTPPFDMPELIWRILAARGLKTKEEIQNLFQPKLKSLAHPFSMDDMDKAAERLVHAFEKNEKILIYGDYDLDGTPAVALLLDGLKRLGFQRLSFFQPSRTVDGYGFHARKIADFVNEQVSLIVTVDVGITDLEAVAEAARKGVDVIVTDHHLPKEQLPKAYAIVNPNKGECGSALQHLCGTGVAFYLILALKMALEKAGHFKGEFDPKELLDLFALATITDMVPLVHENRILVKHGLVQLAQTRRPGLRKLFAELGYLNKNLTSQDVAFRIAPKLNALTRLDEGLRAIDVFLAEESQAAKIIDQVMDINRRRVEFQNAAKAVAEKLVKNFDKSKFLWIHSNEFHPGVISLLANDIMGEFGVPVFVGAQTENGQILGSARAPSTAHNLQSILGKASPVLHKWGGHQLAAGFELQLENTEQFQELLNSYFAESNDTSTGGESNVFYDAEAKIKELNFSFMKWYDGMGPFGNQFEAPKLLLKGVRAKKVKTLKGSYLKYTLAANDGEVEALWFKGAQKFPEGCQVDTIITPQWNEYNGVKSVQALIQHMRLS